MGFQSYSVIVETTQSIYMKGKNQDLVKLKKKKSHIDLEVEAQISCASTGRQ